MNGYNYQQHGPGDNRQPPSIPSITSLQIERPLSSASPNPSQLPPLNQSFPSSTNFLPPLSNRPDPNGAQNHHPNQSPFITEKTANLSNIAPQQVYSSHPFGQYAPQSYPQAFHLPPNYPNGDVNHTSTHNYPGPSTQLPSYIETIHHDQRNLLPPFNPQPPQQQQSQNRRDTRLPDQRPVPVVGSQGRRGVLPSAPGRPSVTPGMEIRGHPANNAVKGADGKYACQFCSKVYLHLKHLKRHHLRHTGERPYQCSLCKETFCRSDILKRHFQKCSIRRGNPTGATHLTHAQAHLRRGSQTPTLPGAPSGMAQTNGSVVGQSAPPSSYRHNWPNGSVQTQASQDPGSARSSRSSSIARRPGSSADDRKSFVSTIGTAPQTGQTSLNPSPSSSGSEERKYNPHQHPVVRDGAPSHYNEQQVQQHHPGQAQPQPQYPAYYGSAPQQFASNSGPETYPGFGYGQTNGYHYPPYAEQARYPEQLNHYQQFFQPGSQDPVMSYQQG